VSGDYAYVIDDTEGLVIVDVSDKEKPVVAGSYNAVEDACSVAISGNYAYVTDKHDGLVIVDVSDKEKPVRTGNYNVRGYARAVVVSGDYAYVADRGNGLVIVWMSATRSQCVQDVTESQEIRMVSLCQMTMRT